MSDPWIQQLPKVCLHEHLDGALRPATVAELAHAEGIALPCLPESLGDWFFDTANSGSLVTYLTTFDLTVSVLQRPENLERVAAELVSDLAEDGVVYAEVRWAPELHQSLGASARELVASVWRGLQSGMEASATIGRPIVVRQILSAMRHHEPSTWAADLAAASRDRGVVGFDLAGPEDGYGARRWTDACSVAREAGLGITIHAGEAAGPASIAEALNVGATRLGHGVRIVEDFSGSKAGAVASAVLVNGVTLEVCPTSNLMTGVAADLEHHPINRLRTAGFRTAISCDNRLMSRTTATFELSELVSKLGWTREDCIDVQRVALGSAFCDAAIQQGIHAALADYEADGWSGEVELQSRGGSSISPRTPQCRGVATTGFRPVALKRIMPSHVPIGPN